MPVAIVGKYEIEYSGVPLPEGRDWAAHAAIFKASAAHPMHRDILFPEQRVCVDTAFSTREEAESGALEAAKALLH